MISFTKVLVNTNHSVDLQKVLTAKKQKPPIYLKIMLMGLLLVYVEISDSILQCRAYAKALHYKEMEFQVACSKKMGTNPVTVVESLIHINNQLHQHEVTPLFEF
jgi:hypothetical protein